MRLRNWILVILVTVGACLVLYGPCAVLFFAQMTQVVAFPSTDSIARQYFAAIVRRDVEAAARLGATARCPCSDTGLLQSDIEHDIARFGGAQIRNLAITIRDSTGSDESPQFALLNFEYRMSEIEA
jgi:hypothetical protein